MIPLLDVLRACAFDPRVVRHRARPRVVHLVPSVAWGGAERLACTMHRLAEASGWDSRLDAPAVDIVSRGIAAETGLAPSPRDGERDLRGWALGARARMRDDPPDVVHAHLPFPDRLSAAVIAARGRPLVATFQLLPQRGRYWSLDEIFGKRTDHTLPVIAKLRPRTRFVAVSRDDRARLAEFVPARALVRIGNAPPLARANAVVQREVAWPQGVVRLLSVGRLHRQKGFDLALAALAREPLRSLAWHWLIAGDGEEREALARAVAEAGLASRVEIVRAAASSLYPHADLVLSPSRWEGMPLVPMEAVEAGVPVVASAIEPHVELLGAVESALLPVDPSAWTDVLAPLVADATRRAELARAEKRALPADPRGEMWEAYLRLYRQLMP